MNCPNNHPFAIYLALNNIQHRHTCAQKPQINSLVERYHRTVLEEFRRAPAHHYEAVSELHTDIDACLVSYNLSFGQSLIGSPLPFATPNANF
jgi:hypothetical protein